MITTCFLCLIVSVFSADVPHPKLAHLASGDVEISLDGAPGMKVYDVMYTIKGRKHQGPFHQGADGRWYHRNHAAAFDGQGKIGYTIVGEIEGKTIVSKGNLQPEVTGLVISPPSRVERSCSRVLRDDFYGSFNTGNWDYEVSMYGGYNWEVQAYVPDARNVFTRNGHLFIKPTLTTDHPNYNDASLHTGVMDLKQMYGYCTNADRYGCYRRGSDGILPPVMSGKIKSKTNIRFGVVEVMARIPRGDWIWPGIIRF
ncbi:beta-1,3-glucan-binding protein-like [Ruditapes philippinarum]|uniref:beta-1,3-glucan-binding protein-like n=1 Tax=Ruditapes philippinarum TaxID=129788 RepID=UPI00295BC6EF|nr:beta-1,3-glucan-binding protein-like [Ruditapes philippinarum]